MPLPPARNEPFLPGFQLDIASTPGGFSFVVVLGTQSGLGLLSTGRPALPAGLYQALYLEKLITRFWGTIQSTSQLDMKLLEMGLCSSHWLRSCLDVVRLKLI